MLNACYLTRRQMPALFEDSEITGALLLEVASAWGMPSVPMAVGGDDNAAGAVDVGIRCRIGDVLARNIGRLFCPATGFLSKPESTVHSFVMRCRNTGIQCL